MSSFSVTIVGGGAFGATAALELRRRGHDVVLLDPGPLPHPDASSTDISKAIRMDYGTDALYAELAELSIQGWEDWNHRWGESLYHPSGILFLSRAPFIPGSFESDSHDLLTARGHRLERVPPEDLRSRFPAWIEGRYADGYFNPAGGWAESGKVVARLLHDARSAGVRILEGERVDRLLEAGGRVEGVLTSRGTLHRSDVAVVAAGAWTSTVLPHVSEFLWAVGQPVLHFRPANPALFRPPHFSVWCADISNTGWYGFPADSRGIVKVANHGPGRRIDPAEPRVVDPDAERGFRAFLQASLPALAEAPIVASRLCLYEESLDGDFWIDHDPERPGLVVAAGGSGHGFKFAPILGPLIADVVEKRSNPYAARFAWRSPTARRTEQARSTGA